MLSAKLQQAGRPSSDAAILQTMSSAKSNLYAAVSPELKLALMLDRHTFSHFVELAKADNPLFRWLYEIKTIKNNWTVRKLSRAVMTMLAERTGLSTDEAAYSEGNLETAMIDHVHDLLLEIYQEFCCEARRKRTTFENRHYRLDLVFYCQILKCYVIIYLEIGEFEHADAGQMNVCLNYYNAHELAEVYNPPMGLILCASRKDALLKYTTSGIARKLFMSSYLTQSPQQEHLKAFIQRESQFLPQNLPVRASINLHDCRGTEMI